MNIPKKYILDTCAIISYFKDIFNDDKDISKEIRNEISTALSPSRYFQSPVKLIIPAMAFIEIRDKWCCRDEEREKIRHEVFLTFSDCENVNICPFEENIMREALSLNKYDCSFDNHDKYFIATALVYESPLITSDEKIKKFQKYCNGKLEIKW